MGAFFFKASPGTNVAVFRAGKLARTERGGGLVFLWPSTSIALVPAGDVPIHYLFTERTRDNQDVVVQGDVVVRLDAARVVARRNFVVNSSTHRWEDPNEREALDDDFRRLVQGLVRREVRARDLNQNIGDVAGIEAAVRTAAGTVAAAAADLGGTIAALFVRGVSPGNAKLKEALEAEERERMLSKADQALHDRRQENAERERALKLYEAETELRVEAENAKLVEQQARNKAAMAQGDAEATRIQLKPFEGMAPGLLLAHSILQMGKSGNVGSLHLTPDLVSAVQAAAR